MGGNLTDVIAWYGAIVATLVLIFDFWKWSRSRARLRVIIRDNVFYPDGGFSKVEKTESGEVKTGIPYYHIEVTNIGELPTTILGVSATSKMDKWFRSLAKFRAKFKGIVSYSGNAFVPHYGKACPYVIGPGEVWSCRLRADVIDGLYQAGFPSLELTASCSGKPIYVRFPKRRGL